MSDLTLKIVTPPILPLLDATNKQKAESSAFSLKHVCAVTTIKEKHICGCESQPNTTLQYHFTIKISDENRVVKLKGIPFALRKEAIKALTAIRRKLIRDWYNALEGELVMPIYVSQEAEITLVEGK